MAAHQRNAVQRCEVLPLVCACLSDVLLLRLLLVALPVAVKSAAVRRGGPLQVKRIVLWCSCLVLCSTLMVGVGSLKPPPIGP